MTDLITDLTVIQSLSQSNRDAFEVMMYQLQLDDDIDDDLLDHTIDEIVAPIIKAIDCTTCGNCCRSLDVYLDQADAQRLADGIHISLDEITTRYVDQPGAAPLNEWGRFQQKPCTFLNGNRCSVYELRPQACRDYPFFTPDFRWMLEDMLDGAALCPIIYNLLNQVTTRVDTIQQATQQSSSIS